MADSAAAASQEKTKMNRREFLNIAWLASMGFLLVDIAGVTLLFAFPRFKEGEFGGVFTIGNAEHDVLPDGEGHPPGKRTFRIVGL